MKTREIYRCAECGATSPRWQGQCPGCKKWNTLEPEVEQKAASGRSLKATAELVSLESPPPETCLESIPTHIQGLDGLLGKGLVPGAVLLLGGEPAGLQCGHSQASMCLCFRRRVSGAAAG